jgi:hypothetical protein
MDKALQKALHFCSPKAVHQRKTRQLHSELLSFMFSELEFLMSCRDDMSKECLKMEFAIRDIEHDKTSTATKKRWNNHDEAREIHTRFMQKHQAELDMYEAQINDLACALGVVFTRKTEVM